MSQSQIMDWAIFNFIFLTCLYSFVKEVCRVLRNGKRYVCLYKDLPFSVGDLDKLVLDVQNGLYPISGMEQTTGAIKQKLNHSQIEEPVRVSSTSINDFIYHY